MVRSRSLLNRAAARVLDAALPRHCVLCGLVSGGGAVCPPCAEDLPRIRWGCVRCGRPLTLAVDRLCAACLRRIPPWDHALAALTYEFPVNELVKRFKFSRNFACGAILGDELLRKVRRTADPPPDCIVPVPLHRSRQFIRGFNQADKLARQLGAGLGLPVHAHVLARTRRTAAQSGLSSSSRKRNLKGAFQAGRVPVPGHVALVDDVLTTGETLAECTRALKQSGICRVTVWIAAVTPATR